MLVALPGVVLAGIGMVHPHHLTAETAKWWSDLHVILLPVFPLLGAAQWVLLSGAARPLKWVGRLAAFGYAAFYSGLDAVAGIAAGAVVHVLRERGPVDEAVFSTGEWLGDVGAWCFLAASLTIVFARARGTGVMATVGAASLLAGSVLFLDSHIFFPVGVIAMFLLAAGMALLSRYGSAAGTEADVDTVGHAAGGTADDVTGGPGAR
jgi:hypothetical protein